MNEILPEFTYAENIAKAALDANRQAAPVSVEGDIQALRKILASALKDLEEIKEWKKKLEIIYNGKV